METTGKNPKPPARKGLTWLIVGIIILVGLAYAGYMLFPLALYFYAYVIMGTTG